MSLDVKTDIGNFLKPRMPGFNPRISQQRMTELVGRAITAESNAIIEAGTGTGKTYAYLLPVLTAKGRVIISTGTKNLQDQLFFNDLPFINEQIGRSTALLKGRSNYLCLERLHKTLEQSSRHRDEAVLEKIVSVYHWSESTKTGDMTEVFDEEDQSAQKLVTSTADNCTGQQCSFYDQCFVYRARQQALQADVVVVNHHLFFADLAIKEDDLGELLPSADVIVIDEAHQIEEIARTFYGQRLSSAQVFELSADVIREQVALGVDDPGIMLAAETLKHAISDLVTEVVASHDQAIGQLSQSEALEPVDMSLADLISRLSHAAQRSPGMASCYSRACRISDMFTLLTEPVSGGDCAHYVEKRTKGFTLHLVPLDVSQFLAPLMADGDTVWILVSATLATTAKYLEPESEPGPAQEQIASAEDPFRHIRQAIGFSDGLEGRYASPFNFPQQVSGFVPNLPDPRDEAHTEALMSALLPLIRAHSGRSLLLFTSHNALSRAAKLLSQAYDVPTMVQGALAKPKLIEKFRATEQAVLLATHSFWEGVDLGGSDLRLLAIDKLPFTSPDDPVFQAKLKQIDLNGGNSFIDLSLPKAAVTLKQGFGRLIRQESDAGLFVLGDARLFQKSYGKILRNCLPNIPWLTEERNAIEYLENLSGNTSN